MKRTRENQKEELMRIIEIRDSWRVQVYWSEGWERELTSRTKDNNQMLTSPDYERSSTQSTHFPHPQQTHSVLYTRSCCDVYLDWGKGISKGNVQVTN
jgi:hypothetical protein